MQKLTIKRENAGPTINMQESCTGVDVRIGTQLIASFEHNGTFKYYGPGVGSRFEDRWDK